MPLVSLWCFCALQVMDGSGLTALMAAVAEGKMDSVRALLKAGADPAAPREVAVAKQQQPQQSGKGGKPPASGAPKGAWHGRNMVTGITKPIPIHVLMGTCAVHVRPCAIRG